MKLFTDQNTYKNGIYFYYIKDVSTAVDKQIVKGTQIMQIIYTNSFLLYVGMDRQMYQYLPLWYKNNDNVQKHHDAAKVHDNNVTVRGKLTQLNSSIHQICCPFGVPFVTSFFIWLDK